MKWLATWESHYTRNCKSVDNKFDEWSELKLNESLVEKKYQEVKDYNELGALKRGPFVAFDADELIQLRNMLAKENKLYAIKLCTNKISWFLDLTKNIKGYNIENVNKIVYHQSKKVDAANYVSVVEVARLPDDYYFVRFFLIGRSFKCDEWEGLVQCIEDIYPTAMLE